MAARQTVTPTAAARVRRSGGVSRGCVEVFMSLMKPFRNRPLADAGTTLTGRGCWARMDECVKTPVDMRRQRVGNAQPAGDNDDSRRAFAAQTRQPSHHARCGGAGRRGHQDGLARGQRGPHRRPGDGRQGARGRRQTGLPAQSDRQQPAPQRRPHGHDRHARRGRGEPVLRRPDPRGRERGTRARSARPGRQPGRRPGPGAGVGPAPSSTAGWTGWSSCRPATTTAT